MTQNEQRDANTKRETLTFRVIDGFLILLLVFASVSFSFFLLRMWLPTAEEYDDPNTDVQESFPWNPNVFGNDSERKHFFEVFSMSFLRHLALLPERVTTATLISGVGYVFLLVFLNRIRNTVSEKWPKLGWEEYVEWGLGSVVGAIIQLAGSVLFRREFDVAVAIVLFSIACLTLRLVKSDTLSILVNRSKKGREGNKP